jgi:drug/metabolite transporter (DMT)-like permease
MTRRHLDPMTLALLGWSIVMSVCAQVALRAGMSAHGESTGLVLAAAAATTPWVWVGIACYVLSTVSWLIILSRIDLAVAYPLGSLSYVFVTLLSVFVLHETVAPLRWVGIAVILGGILVVARGERDTAR